MRLRSSSVRRECGHTKPFFRFALRGEAYCRKRHSAPDSITSTLNAHIHTDSYYRFILCACANAVVHMASTNARQTRATDLGDDCWLVEMVVVVAGSDGWLLNARRHCDSVRKSHRRPLSPSPKTTTRIVVESTGQTCVGWERGRTARLL